MTNIIDKATDIYKKETGKPAMMSADTEEHGLSVYIEAFTEDFIIWLIMKAFKEW